MTTSEQPPGRPPQPEGHDASRTPEVPAPVHAADLGPWTRRALWGLRMFAILVSAMVVYTFISQL